MKMVQVTVKVDYEGKSYMTNVLTKHGASKEEIFSQALDQIKKQVQS
ncbi:BA3454 family stress response protein [Bacillus massiliglaciei]|nr:BA3454 family stress response protein [Bacillus massiliglaciei]